MKIPDGIVLFRTGLGLGYSTKLGCQLTCEKYLAIGTSAKKVMISVPFVSSEGLRKNTKETFSLILVEGFSMGQGITHFILEQI